MSNLNKEALDNYITGNYGEDQFKFGFDIPVLYCTCHEDVEIVLIRDKKNELLFEGECDNCGNVWTVQRKLV